METRNTDLPPVAKAFNDKDRNASLFDGTQQSFGMDAWL